MDILVQLRSWFQITYKNNHFILPMFCLMYLVGCSTHGHVRIVSNPTGARFSIYDKNGKEVHPMGYEWTLYDENKQKIQSPNISLYYSWKDEYKREHFSVWYEAIKTQSGGYIIRYDKETFGSSGGKLPLYDIDNIFDANHRPITAERNTIANYTTPQDVLWEDEYDYVKFEIAGYPSQTVNKIQSYFLLDTNEPENRVIFADLAKGSPSNTSSQRGQSSSTVQVSPSNEPGIEQAVSFALQKATIRVPKNSVIAVIPIITSDNALSIFLTGESEFLLVEQGFSVVDRAQLDRIRTEQRLQLSGEIDSATISSIGRFSGADYIVTGQIDGSGSLQRLRLQVLEVQTADVIGTASEQYGESQLLTNPIGLATAIQQAIENATTSVSPSSRLAIVEISANSSINSFIYGESEYLLKNKGFRIVDRAQLDRVRTEQSMQQSNEFDDRTIANVGKLAGADYLITIRVDGRGGLTRLRWRILNTQTALVAGAASVHFSSEVAPETVAHSLDNALKSALEQATAKVVRDARLAIVQFNSADSAVRGENVVYSLENELVTKGFRVVDRSQLDAIRAEQRYQRSGEVDSRTAVDIGKFAGARYIVTGSIDGADSLRRFRLRVLDSETAEVVGVASVRY